MIFGLSKILCESDFLKLILVNFKDAFILNYNLISKKSEETKESKMKNSIKEFENNDNANNENDYLTKKINDIINNNFILPNFEFDIFNTLYKN